MIYFTAGSNRNCVFLVRIRSAMIFLIIHPKEIWIKLLFLDHFLHFPENLHDSAKIYIINHVNFTKLVFADLAECEKYPDAIRLGDIPLYEI